MRTVSHARRKLGPGLLGLLLLGASLAWAQVALASHGTVSLSDSNFEIDNDANLKVDDPSPSRDWANVNEDRQGDKATGQTDDSFGNGTKEDTAVPSVVDGSIPNNKSDLLNFGVYLETNTKGKFLHVFWRRVQEPQGTTNMDFEFNQLSTLSGNGITHVRKAGDMLLQYDLSQGGVNPQLFISRWVETGNKSLCEAANSTPCWGEKKNLSAAGDATGSINTSPIPASEADGLGDISSRTFGEASIDFSALVGSGSSGCTTFGSAYLKSRSSDSFTAALKDFIAPRTVNVTNCGSLKIVKTDGTNNLSGAKFKVYEDDGDSVFEPEAGDVQVGTECTTTSNGTGDCTFSDLFIGDKFWVLETQAPAGYQITPPNPVLREITSDTEHVVTFVDTPALGSLTVTKRDDGGNLVSGVTFTLTGTSTSGESVDLECTTGGSGTCSFTDVPVGTYTLDEDASTLPSGYSKDPAYPQSVTITSGTTAQASATNPRTHRVIVVVCHEATESLFPTSVEGPSTKQSIASVPAGLAAKGVTQADLCGMGGASFGGLGHVDVPMTAKISSSGH